jgi:6-phosphogluconolactonase (cycloisomerase 2 family)
LSKSKNLFFLVIAFTLLIPFQNCGRNFQTINVAENFSASASQDNAGSVPDPGPSPTPSATPTPTPTASSAPQLQETRVYFGSQEGISHLKIDHSTGTVTFTGTTAFQGQNVGWLNYEPMNQKILSVDAGVGKLQTNTYDPLTGALGTAEALSIKAEVVHSSLVPANNKFFLYAASYDRGQLDLNTLSSNLSNPQVIAPSISYGSEARTHSSAYDSKRKLLFVANLALNRVSIYRIDMVSGNLTLLSQATVTAVRTLLYHAGYDKLFVATESYAGPSQIISYSIIDNQSSVQLQSEGSLNIPLSGADIKIDSVHRYALATAREAGKESVWGMPITSEGKKDTARNPLTISIDRPVPRSLEISADGQYIVVAMDSPQSNNIQVFKLNYSTNLVFQSAQRIFQYSLASQGILCSLSIPYMK